MHSSSSPKYAVFLEIILWNVILLGNKSHPGIPKTPKPSERGRSPISGRIYGGCVPGFTSVVAIVCVLQPKFPTTYFPTGKFLFLESVILKHFPQIHDQSRIQVVVNAIVIQKTEEI